jgi:hypothetical protein
LPEREARSLRWLLLGGLLALPISLASPSPLVRIAPSIAIAALIGALIHAAVQLVRSRRAVAVRALAALIAVALTVTYGVSAPLAARLEIRTQADLQHDAFTAIVTAPLGAADRDVIVLDAWWYLWPGKTGLAVFRPDTHVATWSAIAVSRALRVERPSPDALVLAAVDGEPVSPEPWARRPDAPGEVVAPGVRARALDADGRRIALAFERPLEGWVLLGYRTRRLVRLAPPPVGGSAQW